MPPLDVPPRSDRGIPLAARPGFGAPTLRKLTGGLRWVLLAALLPIGLVGSAGAQQDAAIRGLLTGYGSVGYDVSTGAPVAHDFTATLAPVMLRQIGDDVLVEGEFEFDFHAGATQVVLEHAEVHYLGFEHLQLKAGRFHLPFGIWMHSTWVNRMPAPPLLYEDTHGAPANGGLMPIPFDVGGMARTNLPLLDGWRTSAAAWASQGPAPGAGGHEHDGSEEDHGGDHEPLSDADPLGYGANYEDNNADKMVGLRLRAASARGVMLQASGFRAAYDEAGDLGVRGLNVGLFWAPGGGPSTAFELRTEGILLHQEYHHHGVEESVLSGGYYAQLSRRLGDFEPVLRWSHLPRAVAGHGPLVERRRQLAAGLNYWISPSVPVKAAYHLEADGTDGFFIEWAVGF